MRHQQCKNLQEESKTKYNVRRMGKQGMTSTNHPWNDSVVICGTVIVDEKACLFRVLSRYKASLSYRAGFRIDSIHEDLNREADTLACVPYIRQSLNVMFE